MQVVEFSEEEGGKSKDSTEANTNTTTTSLNEEPVVPPVELTARATSLFEARDVDVVEARQEGAVVDAELPLPAERNWTSSWTSTWRAPSQRWIKNWTVI